MLARKDAIDANAEPGGQPLFQMAEMMLRAGSPDVAAELLLPL